MRLEDLSRPTTPGLFVTGTSTEIGKTLIACLIADQMRRFANPSIGGHGETVGVFKPLASGCRKERGNLIAEDAEQLAHAANLDPRIGGLDLVSPLRFKPAVTPAMALEMEGNQSLDWTPVQRALDRLEETCTHIVAEGVGGVLAPLETRTSKKGKKRTITVLDLMAHLRWPAIIVADASLGTLNHTSLTCRALKSAGVKIAGVVLNRYDPESDDESIRRNGEWIRTMNNVKVLGLIPRSHKPWDVTAIDPTLRDAIDTTIYSKLCSAPSPAGRGPG